MPTIAANGSYIGTPSGSVFLTFPLGVMTLRSRTLEQHQSANFDLLPGQQAFLKIVLIRGNNSKPWQYWSASGPCLSPNELRNPISRIWTDGRQRGEPESPLIDDVLLRLSLSKTRFWERFR